VARGIDQDVGDIAALIARGLVKPEKVWELFDAVVRGLYRSAIDPGPHGQAL
jgi:hypothetical protein